MKKLSCPCCGNLTFDSNDIFPGSFEICPVCYWEDDDVQFSDPEYRGGANTMSLNEARKNYLEFGAKSREVLQYVRAATDEEVIKPN